MAELVADLYVCGGTMVKYSARKGGTAYSCYFLMPRWSVGPAGQL